MSMVPTRQVDARLATDLATTLKRLREARADGAPDHDPQRCSGCFVCIVETRLNRLIERLPKGDA